MHIHTTLEFITAANTTSEKKEDKEVVTRYFKKVCP